MLNLLENLIVKKLVLVLGDNYAKVIFVKSNKILDDVTIENIQHKEDMKKLIAFLSKYKKVNIYILLNSSEQSFETSSIPTNNPLLFKQMLERRMRKDRKKPLIKGYYRLKSKAKKTDFVMVDIGLLSPLKEWLEFLDNVSNNIAGIYSFPIELKDFYLDIEKYLKTKSKNIPKAKWVCLVFESETSGFRISVLKNQELVFTRLLHHNPLDTELNANSASAIKTQIVGTIEYLRRIGFKDIDGINIYMLVSKKFDDLFLDHIVEKHTFTYIPLVEIHKKISKYNHNIDLEKLPDKLFAKYFITKGRYLGFVTQKLKQTSLFLKLNLLCSVVILLTFTLVFTLSLLSYKKISDIEKNVEKNNFRKNKYESILETIREETFGFDIDEDKVIDVSRLHNKLINESKDPIKLIIDFKNIKPNNIFIQEINWEVFKEKQIKFKIAASLQEKELSFEQLFSQYDAFLRKVKVTFSDYDITHSELPDTISFQSDLEKLPIDIQIMGPKNVK